MSRIGPKHTAPEMIVRRLLHSLGFRYRLHRKELPGTPDIVLPGLRTVIFVHGCFWHAHGCKIGRPPKTRLAFWGPKLERNRERDISNRAALEDMGWTVETVWQCEIRDRHALAERLTAALGAKNQRYRSTPSHQTGRLR